MGSKNSEHPPTPKRKRSGNNSEDPPKRKRSGNNSEDPPKRKLSDTEEGGQPNAEVDTPKRRKMDSPIKNSPPDSPFFEPRSPDYNPRPTAADVSASMGWPDMGRKNTLIFFHGNLNYGGYKGGHVAQILESHQVPVNDYRTVAPLGLRDRKIGHRPWKRARGSSGWFTCQRRDSKPFCVSDEIHEPFGVLDLRNAQKALHLIVEDEARRTHAMGGGLVLIAEGQGVGVLMEILCHMSAARVPQGAIKLIMAARGHPETCSLEASYFQKVQKIDPSERVNDPEILVLPPIHVRLPTEGDYPVLMSNDDQGYPLTRGPEGTQALFAPFEGVFNFSFSYPSEVFSHTGSDAEYADIAQKILNLNVQT